jgi:hypothetical protein
LFLGFSLAGYAVPLEQMQFLQLLEDLERELDLDAVRNQLPPAERVV